MTFVFVSNYLTHHQKPFCNAMFSMLRGDFVFISTMPFEQERLNMGWKDESEAYELRSFLDEHSREKAYTLVKNADVVILGSAAEMDNLIQLRMRNNKLTFRYSERLYKKGRWRALNPKNWIRNWNENLRYADKQLYLLCASAYAAADFALLGAYKNKTFQWGYFPEIIKHNVNDLMRKKLSVTSAGCAHPCASILWAGRLIDWKHPEISVELAAFLKDEGYAFKLSIIGNGVLEQRLKELIDKKGLWDCVEMLGSMTPDKVREHMEQADIFLFTSDFNEGWGAVLNEAMNSGCAVVASHAVGSTPFLIMDGSNGLIYRNGNFNSMRTRVTDLLDDLNYCHALGRNAYVTIAGKWNAEEAAARLIALSRGILENRRVTFADGPCSEATLIKNNWFNG